MNVQIARQEPDFRDEAIAEPTNMTGDGGNEQKREVSSGGGEGDGMGWVQKETCMGRHRWGDGRTTRTARWNKKWKKGGRVQGAPARAGWMLASGAAAGGKGRIKESRRGKLRRGDGGASSLRRRSGRRRLRERRVLEVRPAKRGTPSAHIPRLKKRKVLTPGACRTQTCSCGGCP
jgi:hypothetical protein